MTALLFLLAVFDPRPWKKLPRADGTFITKPWLQLGNAPGPADPERYALLWEASEEPGTWEIEVRGDDSAEWSRMPTPQGRALSWGYGARRVVWQASLQGLRPGAPFEYRVLRNGQVAFSARGKARPHAAQPYRFLVFGDSGDGSSRQRAVARQAWRCRPDLVLMPGDLVYPYGRASEYRYNFFPVYNADEVDPHGGVPLLRSVPFVGVLGNHDGALTSGQKSNLYSFPDTLAYFFFWSLPLNGPVARVGDVGAPVLNGPPERQVALVDAAGGRLPRMGMYSFDHGNAHWTVLDSNPYVRWTDAALRDWVRRDLAAAASATWRFVMLHHPPFQSSPTHQGQQQMRLLADLFQEGGVDVVFAGHVHNYQRSRPLRFSPTVVRSAPGPALEWPVRGEFEIDRTFDGALHTEARGVIYIVTGAGGANLYDGDLDRRPQAWQPFTARYVGEEHSLTQVDVRGGRLVVRQLSVSGAALDHFELTRAASASK